jgi:hypothetical protein
VQNPPEIEHHGIDGHPRLARRPIKWVLRKI